MYHSGGYGQQYSEGQSHPPGNRGGPPPLPPRSTGAPLPPLPPRPAQYRASPVQPNFRPAADPVENLSSSFGNLTTGPSSESHLYHLGEQQSYVSPPPVPSPSTRPRSQEHLPAQSQENKSTYPPPPTRPLQPVHESFQETLPSQMPYFPPPPPFPSVEEVKGPESPIPTWEQIGRTSQSIPQQPTTEPPPNVVIKIKDLIRPTRGSRDVLQECPYPESVVCPVRCYFPKATADFFVCSYCFEKHIRGSIFDNRFDSSMSSVNEKRWCNFAALRAQTLWSKTLELSDFEPLKAYMAHRASIQNCHGIEGVKGTEKVRWFTPMGGEIEGFVSCEACYEDVILASSFSTRFKPYEVAQPADVAFACDIAIKYVARALKEYSKRNDWNGFISAAAHRMLQVPTCSQYQPVPSVSRSWYHPKWHLPKFASCEACYLDYFAITPMESRFERYPNHLIQKEENRICTMGYLPMRVAAECALNSNNYRLFYENARIFVESPPCSADGITDGKWYTLKSGFENFDLCPSCYSCYIETTGFGSYFKETSYPAGTIRCCDFWPSQPKWRKWMEKLAEVIYVNDFTVLEEFIVINANIPPCPKSELTSGLLWYGTSDFLFCQQCYEDAVKGTKLVPRLRYHALPADSPQRCALYSPRMRRIWAQACEQDDFDGFTAVAVHRNQIYIQTVPVIKGIIQRQRLALARQQYLNAQSSFYNFMDGATSTSINYTGIPQTTYTYGAADVGYGFATQFGVDGARLGKQALEVTQSAMSETAKVGMLENIWREVE